MVTEITQYPARICFAANWQNYEILLILNHLQFISLIFTFRCFCLNCAHIKAFVQIDRETNQVMAVPTPVIGRNLQVLSDELSLGGAELKTIQNGETLTFVIDEEPVTMGIDLKSDTGIRFANGDGEQWRKEGKREWDKYTFGIYGCWVMDDDGNLDYVPEEEYTEELWNEQKKAAGRHAFAVARK